MTKTTFRLKLLYVYTLLLLTFCIYVVAKTYTYQLYVNQNTVSKEIETVQSELDEMNISINTLNAHDVIVKKFPKLTSHNNIYYFKELDE